jgi:tRNA threonylcarbamoyladenosine biosynthesis protein TsaE
MYKEILIDSLKEMEEFANTLSKEVFPGFVLCLEGDLGAGKTTFTKFFGKGMGVLDTINSPTFTIMKVYEGDLELYHMDVYRLHGIGSDYDLEEYIYNDGVCVIEWYRNIMESIPEERLEMSIKIIDSEKRLIEVKGNGKYEKIIEKIGY